MTAKTGARLPRGGGGPESRPARRKRVKGELAVSSQAALQERERKGTASGSPSKICDRWSEFCAMWSTVGELELASRPLDQLGPEDAAKVVRTLAIEHEAEARAAMLIAEEYARVELAKLAPAVTWFILRLVQTPEDRSVLASLMKFLDRHHVSDLVGSWDAPEELLACHRDVHGHERHLLAPRLTDAGARERVYERLRNEGIVTDLGRERVPNHVIAAAMGETLGAHRQRQHAARKASGRK